MAGYTESHLAAALVAQMVTNSTYPTLAGEPMTQAMLNEMTASMTRLSVAIHEHVVSWWNSEGGGIFPDEKVKMVVDDPVSGYLYDKVDDDTIKYNITTYKLYVDNVPIATTLKRGGAIIGANPSSILYMSGNELMARVQTSPLLSSSDIEVPSARAVKLYVDSAIQAISIGGGIGDMLKSTYDTNSDGIVDDTEKLNGQLASYYLNWNNFTNTPTTITGYGITNVYTKTETLALTWDYTTNVINKPTSFNPITHDLIGSYHDVAGLTVGHVLKATGATTFNFGAITYSDVGAEAALGNPGTNGYVLASTTAGIRSWVSLTGGSMVYPGAGIAISTGSAWGTSITDNSTNWNAAQPGHASLTSISGLSYTALAFVKMTAAGTFALDTTTYLSSLAPHNLLSSSHSDALTGSVVRGDIIYGNSTPKWARLAFPATPTGKILQATATDIAWSTNPITIGSSASISGNNTGDVTLTTDHGLALTNQILGMGTPSSITISSTNSVTTTTHTHAITANLGLIGVGSAQYQLLITGATPFTPSWALATNLIGANGLNSLSYSSLSFVKMSATGTFTLDTATYLSSLPSHVHGNITNAGYIGSTSNLPLITGTSGIVTTGTFGTAANTFCVGNDSRLSNSRTPIAHQLDSATYHTVAGLTTGHFLKATSATTFGFAVHGLTYSDVGAAATSHTLEGHTATVTLGKILKGTGSNTFGWLTLGSALKILRVNSGGTDIEWATESAAMAYPGAGIANSTGSAWGTSYTVSGTGTVVALTAGPSFSDIVTFVGTTANTLIEGHVIYQNRASANYLWANTASGYLLLGANGNSIGLANALLQVGTAAVTLRYGSSTTDTKLATTSIGVSVTGDVSATTATIGGIGIGDSSDRTGLLQINRLGTTGYTGVQIYFSSTGMWSFMGNETNCGIYDDANAKWILYATENAELNLYYNNSVKLATSSTGISVTGGITTTNTVDSTITAHATRGFYTTFTSPSVTVNATNNDYLVGIYMLQGYDIVSGITDSGYRQGLLIQAYSNDAGLLGTLDEQMGMRINYGQYTSSGSGTITSVYGIYLNLYDSGSTTMTNRWSIYSGGSTAKMYHAGSVSIGTTSGLAKLSINGGVNVGGTSDPGDNNLSVDGTIVGNSTFSLQVSSVSKCLFNPSVTSAVGNIAYQFNTLNNLSGGKLLNISNYDVEKFYVNYDGKISDNTYFLGTGILSFYFCDGFIVGGTGDITHVTGHDLIFRSGSAYGTGDNKGGDFIIEGGTANDSGNGNGGNTYIYGGQGAGTGSTGLIYIGTGSTGTNSLAGSGTGTSILYYNRSTGQVTYGDMVGSSMVYPGVGVAVSTGSAWTTSLTAANIVMTSQVNSYSDFAQTFKDNIIRIDNPADTYYYTITAGAITANRVLNLPVITTSDTLAVLGLAQTFTGTKTFYSSGIKINNPANTYAYTFVGAAIAAARSITLPLLTAGDTLVTEDFTQTLTNKTISAASNTLSGVTIVSGTPADGYIGVWTSASGLEGTSGLSYSGTVLNIAGDISLSSNYGILFSAGDHHSISMADQSGATGYNLTIEGATAITTGYGGGSIWVFGGAGSGTGIGGNITLKSGNGGTSASSGNIYIYPSGTGNAIGNLTLCYSGSTAYGYVGIRGAANTSWALSVTGGIYATGNIMGGSDIRDKIVHGGFKNVLNNLMKITPIYYERKDTLGKLVYGFSAQELNNIYPEIGVYDKNTEKYGIDYMGLITWNSIAIQELKSEKDREISRLKLEVMGLKKRVSTLESMLN
jgi:hypothetical protein